MTELYLTMPQPGETITEGTIVEWKVKAGDTVNETDPIAQLETEKAVFDYESPFEGRIVKILHEGGERVKVAHPIAIMDVPEEKAKIYKMMGIGKAVEETAAAKGEEGVARAPEISAAPVKDKQKTPPGGLRMAPFVRKLAKEKGLSDADLQRLAAKDPAGRVTKEAIEAFLGGAPKKAGPEGEYTVQTCSAIRMRIADNMVRAKTKIPHAHNGIAVDMTQVITYRDKHKDEFKRKNGTNLNLLSLIYPALVKCIQDFPTVNASYDDTREPHRIKLFKQINLGVAVGTEHGLVIPVVRDIGRLGFNEFNVKLNDVVERAQKQTLKPDDLIGATIIFNNFGFFGTQIGVQIIGYPMSTTLGMSVIEKRVVAVDDKPAIRTMCDFVLSFDHRVMDGRETGLFLSALKKEIESLKFEHVTLKKPLL